MSSASLWGELPPMDPGKPPVTILREQATILTEATKRTLVGKVETDRSVSGRFGYTLSIVAPALGNYEYGVLYLMHEIDFYPATVTEFADRPSQRICANEQELLDA